MLGNSLNRVREVKPSVHLITNSVTACDCANILLACGSSPIVASDLVEVEEVATHCDALVLNIGNFNAPILEAMVAAGKRANSLENPVILDPAGVNISAVRAREIERLLKEVHFTVIRGNASEICTLIEGKPPRRGGGAEEKCPITEGSLEESVAQLKTWAAKMGSIIAMTGAIDFVTDGEEAYAIRNGTPMFTSITGSGCMLSALAGAFVAANRAQPLVAVAAAVAALGHCGELSADRMQLYHTGSASFKNHLIDEVFKLTGLNLDAEAVYEQYR